MTLDFRFHYAAYLGKESFFGAVCMPVGYVPFTLDIQHAITIVRGHVDCDVCKQMMGL